LKRRVAPVGTSEEKGTGRSERKKGGRPESGPHAKRKLFGRI